MVEFRGRKGGNKFFGNFTVCFKSRIAFEISFTIEFNMNFKSRLFYIKKAGKFSYILVIYIGYIIINNNNKKYPNLY